MSAVFLAAYPKDGRHRRSLEISLRGRHRQNVYLTDNNQDEPIAVSAS